MFKQETLRQLVAVGLVTLVGLSVHPALGAETGQPPAPPKVAIPAGPPTITVGHAALTPQNFVRFSPPAGYVPDDTAVEEDKEPAKRERVLSSPQLAAQQTFSDAPPTPGPPGPPPTPGLMLGSLDGVGPPDPQVAAGDSYVAVIDTDQISFYDKSGVALSNPSASPYPTTSYQLFQRFLAPKNKDSSINQDNLNLHAGFPANPKPPCDLNSSSYPQKSCIKEVYDLRVAYDAKHKRFIFVGNARNRIWGCQDTLAGYDHYSDPAACDPLGEGASQPHFCAAADTACRKDVAKLARRYTVIAMTNAEDPRQGFATYWLPTAGDWPSIAINGSRLLITENSICHDPVACRPANNYPEIYILSTDDMATGSSNVSVHWYLTEIDMTYAYGLRPVVSHDPGRIDYYVAPNNGTMQVWASKDPAKPLLASSINLGETGMARGSIVLQSSKLYYAYASGAWCQTLKPALADCPLKVRLLAIGVSPSNNALSLTKSLDYSFGKNGPGDDPSDLVSYELPSLEVTKNGDVVIAYIRRAVKTVAPLSDEARYSVFYHNETKTRPSAVLKTGQHSAAALPAIYGGGVLDFAGQALDPSDGTIVWITHAFAKANGSYGMAWGAVKVASAPSPPNPPTPAVDPKCPGYATQLADLQAELQGTDAEIKDAETHHQSPQAAVLHRKQIENEIAALHAKTQSCPH